MEIGKIKEASACLDDPRWVDSPTMDGVKYLVRSWHSPLVVRAQARLSRDLDDQQDVDKATIAEAVLVDWKGLTDKGKVFQYSTEDASELLESSVFLADVRLAMASVTKDTAAKIEDLVGNSKPPSKGKKKAAKPKT